MMDWKEHLEISSNVYDLGYAAGARAALENGFAIVSGRDGQGVPARWKMTGGKNGVTLSMMDAHKENTEAQNG